MSTRANLLHAALERLRSGGLDAITTVAVAADVGLSQAGVYRHFSSVDELRAEAVALVGSEWFGELALQRDRILLHAEQRGPVARQAFAIELGQRFIDGRAVRELIDRHRTGDDLLAKRIADLVGDLVDDLVGYLSSEIAHAAPGLLPVVEARQDLMRFHAALFVEDLLTLARTADEHLLGGGAHDITSLLAHRIEAGWFGLVADLDEESEVAS